MEIPKIMVIIGTGVILTCIFVFELLKKKIQDTIGTKGYLMNIYLLLIGFFFSGYAVFSHKMVKEEPIDNNMLLASILLLGSLFVLLSLLMMKQLVSRVMEARMNQMDCATGLLNKNAGTQSIVSRMKQKESFSAFYILDIDHFKSINDQYGHMEGDNLLKQTACALRNTTNGEDIVYRFGGDEFGIYASRDHREELVCLGEKIVENIRKIQCHGPGEPIRITCSLGAVEIKGDETFEQVFRGADRVLYEVKKSQKGEFRLKTDCTNKEAAADISFREYNVNHLPDLTDICTRAFNDDTRIHTNLMEDGPAGYQDGSLITNLVQNDRDFQEIWCGDKLVGGFAVKEKVADTGILDLLFIDPQWKSMGIGRKVWRKIETRYSYQKWQVETPQYSKRNLHFYCETCGFHQIGEVVYEEGENSVLMEKTIDIQ